MKEKHLDLITGIVFGVTLGLFYPVAAEYKALIMIVALALGVRLVVAK